MIRSLLLILSLVVMMLNLASCSERIATVSKSPDSRVVVYEGHKAGPGQVPDSVRSFLLPAGSSPTADEKPIFEGQDVGLICYSWPSPTELNLKISGGYVDQVASQWQGPDGLRVTIRYVGTSGCVWHPTS